MKLIGNLTGSRNRRACLMLLGIFIAVGIAIGSILEVQNYEAVKSPWIHQFFSPIKCGRTPLEMFVNFFLSSGIFIGIAFFIGLFAFGQPIGIAMLIFRGIGIGVSVAGMYEVYGADAFSAIMLLILPKAAISVIIDLLAVRELIRTSNILLGFIVTGEYHDDKRRSFRLYCIKFIVLIIISLITSALDTALNYAFSYML